MPKTKIDDRINPLFAAGLEFQNTLNEQKWPFCFIGGLAVVISLLLVMV